MDHQKRQMWVLEQIKPELSLEAKMAKLRLLGFEHIMRKEDSLETTIILGEALYSKKKVIPTMGWTDSIKESRS